MNRRAVVALLLGLATTGLRAQDAIGPAIPPDGFDGGRYAALWTKSPFAIATPEATAASADYKLVGLAQFDGVSYASLIDEQSPTQEHFVLASDKPVRNLTLVSISRGADGSSAIVLHNGETLSLKLENAAPATAGATGPNTMPGTVGSPFPNAPAFSNPGGFTPSRFPPHVRFHHPPIALPARPQ